MQDGRTFCIITHALEQAYSNIPELGVFSFTFLAAGAPGFSPPRGLVGGLAAGLPIISVGTAPVLHVSVSLLA